MALKIGTQLGTHEITALLGKGGMGEVYGNRRIRESGPSAVRNYDVTPDGKYFLGILAPGGVQSVLPTSPPIQVVLNWFTELPQRVPK